MDHFVISFLEMTLWHSLENLRADGSS